MTIELVDTTAMVWAILKLGLFVACVAGLVVLVRFR
jgi:hypothetical protein